MTKYPQHLCPLCGKVLRIAENNTRGATQIEVKIECIDSSCPYKKLYTFGVEDIREHGVQHNYRCNDHYF